MNEKCKVESINKPMNDRLSWHTIVKLANH